MPLVTTKIATVTGPGNPQIYECWNKVMRWANATSSMRESYGKGIYVTQIVPTQTQVHWFTNTSVPTITRCDGWPRVLGPASTPVTLTYNEPVIKTKGVDYEEPPKCSYKDDDCKTAYSVFSGVTTSMLSSIYSTHFAQSKTGLPGQYYFDFRPPCNELQTKTACAEGPEIKSCRLAVHGATVMYWPTHSAGNFCGRKTKVEATATVAGKPNTAVFKGATVTSPSALVIIPQATRELMLSTWAAEEWEKDMFRQCGTPQTKITLAVDPEEISTFRRSYVPTASYRSVETHNGQRTTKPYTRYSTLFVASRFDFADLNEASVPYDAYVGANGMCGPEYPQNCPKTISWVYKPIFSVPQQVKTAYPELADCEPSSVDPYQMTYLPITAATLTVPGTTHNGAVLTLGPQVTKVEPAALQRIILAEATPTPEAAEPVDAVEAPPEPAADAVPDPEV